MAGVVTVLAKGMRACQESTCTHLTTEHMGDSHLMIVNYVCQVVRWPASALHQDGIFSACPVRIRWKVNVAVDEVLVADRARFRLNI